MGKQPRLSLATLKVLSVFLSRPTSDVYGLELMELTGLASGTLYPILARLEKHGWLEGDWEEIDASKEGRRPRRYYRLTPEGLAQAREVVEHEMAPLQGSWSLPT